MNARSQDQEQENVLFCQECRRSSHPDSRGWRGYRTDELEMNEPPALRSVQTDAGPDQFHSSMCAT